MNSEELRILEDERQKIMDEILEELETKSLKDLFLEMRNKENRMEEVKEILEELNWELDFYNKTQASRNLWAEDALNTQSIINEIEGDYSNYIQGGEGYISEYCHREHLLSVQERIIELEGGKPISEHPDVSE